MTDSSHEEGVLVAILDRFSLPRALEIKAARDMGAAGALVYHARGIGPRERLGLLGSAVEAEKDVVSILVATGYQDVVFEAVYHAAELGTPGAGLAYITPVEKMATYVPRDMLERANGPAAAR